MKRNKFSLSNYHVTTGQMGTLIPIGWYETLPGDSIQQATSVLLRTNPLNTPVMHPVQVRIHKWFVPLRIIWQDFENFITGGPDGLDASVHPTITGPGGAGIGSTSLLNYLGGCVGAVSLEMSALPVRAYQKIFTEWYRDEDLVTAPTISTASGADTTTTTSLQSIAWEKDEFTASRPWTQKGAAVTLPLGTSAPVTGVPGTALGFMRADTNAAYGTAQLGTDSFTIRSTSSSAPSGTAINIQDDPALSNVIADLSAATSVSINTLRQSLALQRFEEWRARFGSRYSEYLRALGVRSSDARLQRPEYLGGGKQTIQFSEVLQTTQTDFASSDAGVGRMYGHGITAARSNRYRRFFEEHGIVMTMLSVRPKTLYYTGLKRSFNRRTKFDYWQPQLEHIGQEAVENREVDVTHGSLTSTFGYRDRYNSYRHETSQVSGEMTPGRPLETWTLVRAFTALPVLNSSFVTCTPSTRVFQETSGQQLLIFANHSIQARRLVSKKATPMTF